MEAIILVKNGIVENRVLVQSLEHGQGLYEKFGFTVVEDADNSFEIGDTYTDNS